MLVVSRQVHQSVLVEELDGPALGLKVTVLAVGGGKVRLGFDKSEGPVDVRRALERLSAAVCSGKPRPDVRHRLQSLSSAEQAAEPTGPDRTELEHDETVHDLGNLLAGIRMLAASALSEIPEASPVRETMARIQATCVEAGELLSARTSTCCRRASAVERRESFDVSALVDGAAAVLATAVTANTALAFDLVAEPAVIRADPVQFRRLLTNLVLNASQALQGRAGEVVVGTGTVELDDDSSGIVFRENRAAGRYHFVEVADTGCGMDAATRARLCEPYFSTKPDGNGHGLGMCSVQRIVADHGGALQVHSEPGAGTTIRVMFPALEPVARPANGEPRPRARSQYGEPAGTLLLMDDDRSASLLPVLPSYEESLFPSTS